jgi:hypothetical protein
MFFNNTISTASCRKQEGLYKNQKYITKNHSLSSAVRAHGFIWLHWEQVTHVTDISRQPTRIDRNVENHKRILMAVVHVVDLIHKPGDLGREQDERGIDGPFPRCSENSLF